ASVVAADARPGDGVLFPRPYHRTPFEAAWREVPDAAPEPTPVDTARPLGTVRRHDPPLDPGIVADRLGALDRVWLVTADEPGTRGDPLGDLLADPDVAGRFEVAERVALEGTVRVVLLVRR
ncbi:MAG TPA: hypothetical protein VK507_23670, partial [Iamia sp.]|nr:hypothetical protein [Iamia sp.]